MSDAELIAAFIAKRGVTKLTQSDRSMSGRDMYSKVRGEKTTDELIAERHVVGGAGGREYVRNGLGEWVG